MLAAGHTKGWPILRGGAQSLTDVLVRHLESLGGRVESGHEVTELPLSDLVLADITPRQLLRIAGSYLSTDYQNQLERFRYGAGAFQSTMHSVRQSPGQPLNVGAPLLFTSEVLLKRLPKPKEPFQLTSHSFFSDNLRSSTPVEPPRANTPLGPTVTFLMAAQRTMPIRLSAKSYALPQNSVIAFCPDPSLLLNLWRVGIQT